MFKKDMRMVVIIKVNGNKIKFKNFFIVPAEINSAYPIQKEGKFKYFGHCKTASLD